MEWFLEPFALEFQQRALVGGIIAALMASAVGVWLVLRGMSFFGDAFVHGILPGIAAAVVFDFSPLLGAAVAALAMVGGISLIHRLTDLKEDTAIGLLFVGMLALGVVIISRSRSFTGDLTSILFGDALGVTWDDILQESILAVIIIAASLLLYRPLLALTFDAGKAATLRMRPQLTHAILLVMVAAAVIGAFRTIGTMLVFSLMVGPPATASLIARTVGRMTFYSAIIAVLSVWLGLLLSFHLGTAGSATMAILPIIAFFVTLIGRWLVGRVRRRPGRRASVAEEVAA